MDIARLLRRAAREFPTSTAVSDGRSALTMEALISRAERMANEFDRLGAAEGESVGILSENRSSFVEADAAIALGRRVRVAMNARLHIEDHRYVAQDADVKVLFHSSGYSAAAQALREDLGITTVSFDQGDEASPWYEQLLDSADAGARLRGGGDEAPAWITYTSGTTGRPKGVVLSHRSLREVAFNLLIELGKPTPGEMITLPQQLSHGAGYFVLPYLLSGAGVFVLSTFDPEQIWSLSAQDSMRTLKVVPAMLPKLLERTGCWGYDTIIYGGAPISPPILDNSVQRFGLSLVQIYGQTEAPMTITCLHKQDHLLPEARFSAGRPWRTVDTDVRFDGRPTSPGETGELFVKGAHLMSNYHRLPEATAEVVIDDWIRTHDMAKVDEQGYVYLQGRSDEMINSGGFNIAPRDVQDALTAHNDIDEAAVFSIPDERWGQVVAAAVRLRGAAQLDAEQIIAFARPRLGIRAPKRVFICKEIPVTPYGKVDRKALLGLLEGEGR